MILYSTIQSNGFKTGKDKSAPILFFYSNTSQIKMLIPQYSLYQIIIIIKINSIARNKAFQRIASFPHLSLIQFSYHLSLIYSHLFTKYSH